MKTTLYQWKRNILKGCTVSSGHKEVATIYRQNSLTDAYIAKVQEKQYLLKRRNYFENTTLIIDLSTHQQTGYITYNTWSPKAIIHTAPGKYEWHYTSFLNRSFMLQHPTGQKSIFKKQFSGGRIEGNHGDDIFGLVMALYIDHKYQKTTFLVISILLLPILFRSIVALADKLPNVPF